MGNSAGSAARSGGSPAPSAYHPHSLARLKTYVQTRMVARTAEALFEVGREDTVPSRINVLRIDSVEGHDTTPDRLGGLAFAPEFARYMRDVAPAWLAQQRRGQARWWDVKYVRGRLYKRFGKEVVEIALYVLRDEVPVDLVAEVSGRSSVWILGQLNLVQRLAPLYWRSDPYARDRKLVRRGQSNSVRSSHHRSLVTHR
jgi:hypothetical protein